MPEIACMQSAEGAEALVEDGRLQDGATPLWIRQTPSGLLPLLPHRLSHVDFHAEVALIHPDPQWLRDHLGIRMARSSSPERMHSMHCLHCAVVRRGCHAL
jgi:hypothetical protein